MSAELDDPYVSRLLALWRRDGGPPLDADAMVARPWRTTLRYARPLFVIGVCFILPAAWRLVSSSISGAASWVDMFLGVIGCGVVVGGFVQWSRLADACPRALGHYGSATRQSA